MKGNGALKGFTETDLCPERGQQAHPVRLCPWVGGRGHQDPDPSDMPRALRSWRSPHLNTHPSAKVGGGRPHLAPIQPRGWLAAATVELGLFIDSSPWPPQGPAPSPGPQGPAAPVISPVRAPGWACADPLSAPQSTHTLSRLWAWVRGDSSGSTRRSWGAASESIPASLGPCGPRWGPEGQARPPPGVFSPRGAHGRGHRGPGRDGAHAMRDPEAPLEPRVRPQTASPGHKRVPTPDGSARSPGDGRLEMRPRGRSHRSGGGQGPARRAGGRLRAEQRGSGRQPRDCTAGAGPRRVRAAAPAARGSSIRALPPGPPKLPTDAALPARPGPRLCPENAYRRGP